MTDEEYVFTQDVKDKKRTARSSFNRVRGTGRRVKMPSDYLSEKERSALSGEVKNYDLKQPMKWAEYKTLPDDLRREYIMRLKNLYGATDTCMGEMLGVCRPAVHKERVRLGIPGAPKGSKPAPEWASFIKHGTPIAPASEPAKVEEQPEGESLRETLLGARIIPDNGEIHVVGTASGIGELMAAITADNRISCRISWELAE